MGKKLSFPPKHEQKWVTVFPERVTTQGVNFPDALNMLLSGVYFLSYRVEQENRQAYLEEHGEPNDSETQAAFDQFTRDIHDQLYDLLNSALSDLLAHWSPDASSVPDSDDPMHDRDITVDSLIAMQDLLLASGVKDLPEEDRAARVKELVADMQARTETMRGASKLSETYRAEVERRQELQAQAMAAEEQKAAEQEE